GQPRLRAGGPAPAAMRDTAAVSHARRSLWHLPPEVATLVRAARLRPGDLPALSALVAPGRSTGPERPGGYGLSLAGVGLWAARRAAAGPVLVDADGPVTGTQLARLVDARAAELHGAGAVLVHRKDDRHLVATLVAAGVAGVHVVLVGARAGAEELATARDQVAQLQRTSARHAEPPVPRARLGRSRSLRPGRRAPLVVLHSSGTTGRPHPRAQRSVGIGQLPTIVSLTAALGARRGEPMLLAAPLAHGHGLSALAAALTLGRSEEHTSELQSRFDLVCRLLLEKKKRL